jgi:hypothetical protein
MPISTGHNRLSTRLTLHYFAEVLGFTYFANSGTPFIAHLVDMIYSVRYYFETPTEPWGIAIKTIHVTREPSQFRTRLDSSVRNITPSKVLTLPFGRIIISKI